MKLNANKFALAGATTATILMALNVIGMKLTCWRMAGRVIHHPSMRSLPATFDLPIGHIIVGLVGTFLSSFVVVWFFAWFYNKLVSR
jgi:hypothetical protein